MGSIAKFDLQQLIDEYALQNFVETGTGSGAGLHHALKFTFSRVYSCEIEPSLAAKAEASLNEWDTVRTKIFKWPSWDFIDAICRDIPADEPILFWLDAHFPGADYGIRGYGDVEDPEIRLPLEIELETISELRPNGRDVIICDDLRIYEDGPFAHGNLPAALRPVCPGERNIDFVHRLMDATHVVEKLYDHEGYIIMKPR